MNWNNKTKLQFQFFLQNEKYTRLAVIIWMFFMLLWRSMNLDGVCVCVCTTDDQIFIRLMLRSWKFAYQWKCFVDSKIRSLLTSTDIYRRGKAFTSCQIIIIIIVFVQITKLVEQLLLSRYYVTAHLANNQHILPNKIISIGQNYNNRCDWFSIEKICFEFICEYKLKC